MDNLKIAVTRGNYERIERLSNKVLVAGMRKFIYVGEVDCMASVTFEDAIFYGEKKLKELNITDKNLCVINFRNTVLRMTFEFMDNQWYLTGVYYTHENEPIYKVDVSFNLK